MTREESIKWLKLLKSSPLIYGEYTEAIDTAIEALSQPIVAKCYEIEKDRIYCSPETAEEVCNALHLYHSTNVQNMHKGEWVDKEIPCNPYPPVFCVECSECGYRVGRETFQENTFNYCPNCGADMRGEEE